MNVKVYEDFDEESFNICGKDIEEVLKKYNPDNYKVISSELQDTLLAIWQQGYETGYGVGYDNGYG